jgi:hypothetical protein
METTVKSGIEYTYNKSEIDKKICSTIDKIKKVIKDNDYQVTSNIKIDFTKVKDYSPIDEYYCLEWRDFSKNQMKNIQKYCNWTSKKPSLRKINSLLHLLSKYFEIEKVRVKVSLREEQIQKARKEWLKARDESERLLKIYKTTKGDFYKSKMSFFNLK